ncbi:hypothetical protein [Myxococcus sp. Y35]
MELQEEDASDSPGAAVSRFVKNASRWW